MSTTPEQQPQNPLAITCTRTNPPEMLRVQAVGEPTLVVTNEGRLLVRVYPSGGLELVEMDDKGRVAQIGKIKFQYPT